MAHIGSKGYYVKKLKEQNVRKVDGKRLESMKTYDLANLYDKYVKNKED
jgi:hypothetical protein